MRHNAGRSTWPASRPLSPDIVKELTVVERSVQEPELERLRDLRCAVADLDDHPACAATPHSLRAATLLRFLRARNGDVPAAAAMFREAMEWRAEFDLDSKLKAWRHEWQECVTPRAKLIREYNYIGRLGRDKWGLPVTMVRFSQGDPGGLVREVGHNLLLLHNLSSMEQAFAEAQELMLRTGTLHMSFVEVYDIANYGLVPNYLQRGLTTAKPYTKYAKVFDTVYPERVRVVLLLRAPQAFSMIWRMMVPLVPEQTLAKIRMLPQRGPNRGGAKEMDEEVPAEMAKWLPPSSIPEWLQTYDIESLMRAAPWGGIVPRGALGATPSKESIN